MTFEEVMQLTRTVSSHTAFEDPECEAYFDLLMTLPEDSLIVEIGLEFGRSSSIALQVVRDRSLRYIGIDPFLDEEIMQKWLDMLDTTLIGCYYTPKIGCLRMRSEKYVNTNPIRAILIDGDHSYEAVLNDLNHFLPHVLSDGYVCLHDCGRESLPDVIKAAREYFGTDDEPNLSWDKYQQAGTLGIWQRKAGT